MSLSSLFYRGQPPSSPASAETRPPLATTQPSPRRTTEATRRAERARRVTEAPVLKLGPAESPSPTPDVSAREQVQQSVDAASKRLAMLDRSELHGQEATDYDLLAGLVRGAQQALKEQDFLRAQSLADKASVLAARLGVPETSEH